LEIKLSWLGGIANQAKVGDGAIVFCKAGIHNDVEPGAIIGYPGVPISCFKASAIYNRLPEMYESQAIATPLG